MVARQTEIKPLRPDEISTANRYEDRVHHEAYKLHYAIYQLLEKSLAAQNTTNELLAKMLASNTSSKVFPDPQSGFVPLGDAPALKR